MVRGGVLYTWSCEGVMMRELDDDDFEALNFCWNKRNSIH